MFREYHWLDSPPVFLLILSKTEVIMCHLWGICNTAHYAPWGSFLSHMYVRPGKILSSHGCISILGTRWWCSCAFVPSCSCLTWALAWEWCRCQNMPDWLFLRAGLGRSSCQCVKVTVGKSCWWWLFCCCCFGFFFLPDVLLYQEVVGTVYQEKPLCNHTPHLCRPGHGPEVCSLLVCAGGPLPVKVLLVTLCFPEPRTLNIADVAGRIFLALGATSQNSGLPAIQLVLQCTMGEGCCVLLARERDSDSQECWLAIGGQG